VRENVALMYLRDMRRPPSPVLGFDIIWISSGRLCAASVSKLSLEITLIIVTAFPLL
jgi:hypothetical protein